MPTEESTSVMISHKIFCYNVNLFYPLNSFDVSESRVAPAASAVKQPKHVGQAVL